MILARALAEGAFPLKLSARSVLKRLPQHGSPFYWRVSAPGADAGAGAMLFTGRPRHAF